MFCKAIIKMFDDHFEKEDDNELMSSKERDAMLARWPEINNNPREYTPGAKEWIMSKRGPKTRIKNIT